MLKGVHCYSTKPSNMICPKYRGKSTGYDDLRDFKFYLQNYAPPNNEIQIINAFEYFVSKKEETKKMVQKREKRCP